MFIGPELQSTAIAGPSPAASRGERVDPVAAPESPGPDDGSVTPAAGEAGRGSAGFEPDSVVVDSGTESLALSGTGIPNAEPFEGGTASGPVDRLKSEPADTPGPAATPATDDEGVEATDGGPAAVPEIAEPSHGDEDASTENEQAGNDDRSQTEANRTLGQVIDLFA